MSQMFGICHQLVTMVGLLAVSHVHYVVIKSFIMEIIFAVILAVIFQLEVNLFTMVANACGHFHIQRRQKLIVEFVMRWVFHTINVHFYIILTCCTTL